MSAVSIFDIFYFLCIKYSMKKGKLRLVNCAARHDAEGKLPESYPYCAVNPICSHKNLIMDAAMEAARKDGHLEVTDIHLVADTRLRLVEVIDMAQVSINYLEKPIDEVKNPQAGHDRTKFILTAMLGEDPEHWQEKLAAVQMQMAQPIIDVYDKLVRLGYLEA